MDLSDTLPIQRLLRTIVQKDCPRETAVQAVSEYAAATNWRNTALWTACTEGTPKYDGHSEFVHIVCQLSVAGFVFRALKFFQDSGGIVPKEVFLPLFLNYQTDAARSEELLKAACAISGKLARRRVPHAVIKGAWTRLSLYDNSKVRTYSDLDFLIDQTDLAAICRCLEEEGFAQGQYDEGQDRILPHADAAVNAAVVPEHSTHPLAWSKVPENRPNKTIMSVLTVEPHTAISWQLGVSKGAVYPSNDELLRGAETLECEYGAMRGLSRKHAFFACCASIYSDAKSRFAIEWGCDFRMVKLCDCLTFLQQADRAWIEDIWSSAAKSNMLEPIELCARFLETMYEFPALWDLRPKGYEPLCDIEEYWGYNCADGKFAPGAKWRTPFPERYFQPMRMLEVLDNIKGKSDADWGDQTESIKTLQSIPADWRGKNGI